MTKPLRQRSITTLRAMLVAQKARRAARMRKLAAVRAIKTSRTPHTKITPEQKTQLVAQWTRVVQIADQTIREINEAIAWRQMPMRARALAVAREHLGVLEQGGNNRGAAVEEIIRANGGVPGEPWCADFDAFCYRQAGSKAVTRAWAAVRNLGFLAGMRVLASILMGLAGDIVCFTFDHTGLLISYARWDARVERYVPCRAHGATHVHTLEGNTGTGGSVSDSTDGRDGVHDRIRPLSEVARVVRVSR